MDVELLHPLWKDFLDMVNTYDLTGYSNQLIIFSFDIQQCSVQSGLQCAHLTNIIGKRCFVF